MVSKSLWGLVLLVVSSLNIGSVGCVRQPREIVILPCPTPNAETIRSLRDDEIPDPILEYLIDMDVYCSAVDVARE